MEGGLTDVGTSDVVETVPEHARDALAVGELELGDTRCYLKVNVRAERWDRLDIAISPSQDCPATLWEQSRGTMS